jgi:UDP-N-acetylmuramoyl-tripeptide--D-alanyl-D-alanine ligase
LLAHQKPEGNFDYEYNWQAKSLSRDDNEVRQAGVLWGLVLLYQTAAKPELAAAIERGFDFFDQHSGERDGARCIAYPGNSVGSMGTIALVALAYVDYLSLEGHLSVERRALHDERLDQYLKMLAGSVTRNGLWHGNFDPKTCEPEDDPSPYSDGEALLALVKAAKYVGRTRLVPLIVKQAKAGRRLNVTKALAYDADSDVTKGYYQWGSMAFYELATSDFPEKRLPAAEKAAYGDAVLDLADWMIDTHKVLTRSRNTAYAFEGIVTAYALAKKRGDSRQAKYACAVDIGLERLVSWQVGGPLPNRFTKGGGSGDAKALGGIQNSAFEPALRLDVTQHQMHATQLARSYLY